MGCTVASMINEDLLRTVADHFREHPAAHVQDHWATETECGTTGCIAGWACFLSGEYNLVWFKNPHVPNTGWYTTSERVEEAAKTGINPAPFDFCGAATKLINLTAEETERLFSASWQPADLLSVPEALEKIAAGASIEEVSAPTLYYSDEESEECTEPCCAGIDD